MQTSKSRAGTLEVPQRTSRKFKTLGSDPDNASSLSPVTRTSVEHSPKVGRRSPHTPMSEKKRPGRVSELESQVAHLEEELKKAKDQLNQAESSKNQAHQEAEKAKKQLAAIAPSEDELEAAQNHLCTDPDALVSAFNEILKLKIQLNQAVESEATQAKHAEPARDEIGSLKVELSETLDLVEKLKTQLNDCKDSESRALEVVCQTREKLETLGSEKLDAMTAYDSLAMELEQTKAENKKLVEKLRKPGSNEEKDSENATKMKKLDLLVMELEQTKAELDENKKLIEKLQKPRSKQETDSENATKTKKLDMLALELQQTKAKLEENKKLIKNLQKPVSKHETDSENGSKTKKLESDLEELKRVLFNKETELKNIIETEKDQCGIKVAQVTDQLVAAQTANAEMEVEMRQLKVQSDQWRKAAEVAAAMLSGGNGKYILDSNMIGGKLNSNYCDEVEDESPKKRNGNMFEENWCFAEEKVVFGCDF